MVPRLIVEIRFGRFAGRKAVVAKGAKLRVGRAEEAGFAVPHDGEMSNNHFELEWDGAVCRLRSLSTIRGTVLNGQLILMGGERDHAGDVERDDPSKGIDVAHGSWIRAGDTVFSVYVEAKSAPKRSVIEDDDELDADERAMRAELRRAEALRQARAAAAEAEFRDVAARGPLYAVLDAARDPRIRVLLQEAPDESRSLYEGTRGQALEDVAPYLVRFREDSDLLHRLVSEGWEKRWGIFLASPLTFRDQRTHLRRFLMVEVEDTLERLYFRFYDPGVFREFVPVSSVHQFAALVGDMEAALCEGVDGRIMRFTKAQIARKTA